jgi:uncharacterized glyoxalase superfamily protein PhnB
MTTFKSIAPIIYCSSIADAKAFWENLGWNIVVEMPNYLIVGHSNLDFHYSNEIPQTVSMVYLEPENVDAVHAEYHAKGIEVSELINQPYGMREFNMVDPFGNHFGFGSVIPE